MKTGTTGAPARRPMRAMPALVQAAWPKKSTNTPSPRVEFWSNGSTSSCFSRSARSTSLAARALRTSRVPARVRIWFSQPVEQRVAARAMHHGDGMAAPTVGVHQELPVAEVPAQDEHAGRPLPADGLLPPGLVLELDHLAELLVGQLSGGAPAPRPCAPDSASRRAGCAGAPPPASRETRCRGSSSRRGEAAQPPARRPAPGTLPRERPAREAARRGGPRSRAGGSTLRDPGIWNAIGAASGCAGAGSGGAMSPRRWTPRLPRTCRWS